MRDIEIQIEREGMRGSDGEIERESDMKVRKERCGQTDLEIEMVAETERKK